jgi:PiT family inorganic phosphate transporter
LFALGEAKLELTGIWMLFIATVATALLFCAINGFHDAANSIATVVSTRVLSPRTAVLWAAFFNFVAMFVFAPTVADTISKIIHIQQGDPVYVKVVLAGLVGAIAWDLLTWWWGLPTSSSHALIGGFAGSGIALNGWGAVQWDILWKVMLFIPIAPLIGFAIGFGIMLTACWLFRQWHPKAIDRLFGKAQLLSAALYSLGHGGNDAQKTMGLIVALLVAHGTFTPDIQISLADFSTAWIILSCHLAIAVGTALGGWRIVKTMGIKVTKLQSVGGFCAETAGAATLFMATFSGIPVSTTHSITGAIIGVGATRRLTSIKWDITTRIILAWVVTIPCSAVIAALTFSAIAAMQ